jgi:hypothetical protein
LALHKPEGYAWFTMPSKKTKLVSAQVVLKSASGKSFDGQTAITAENIADYSPSHASVTAAAAGFRAAGFEVGDMVGNSFSITAPKSTFEKFFKIELEQKDSGEVQLASAPDDGGAHELPLKALPPDLSQLVAAVTFSPPPDFGPSSYY